MNALLYVDDDVCKSDQFYLCLSNRDADGFGRGRGMDQGRNGAGRFGSPDFHNGDMSMMMMLDEPAVIFAVLVQSLVMLS